MRIPTEPRTGRLLCASRQRGQCIGRGPLTEPVQAQRLKQRRKGTPRRHAVQQPGTLGDIGLPGEHRRQIIEQTEDGFEQVGDAGLEADRHLMANPLQISPLTALQQRQQMQHTRDSRHIEVALAHATPQQLQRTFESVDRLRVGAAQHLQPAGQDQSLWIIAPSQEFLHPFRLPAQQALLGERISGIRIARGQRCQQTLHQLIGAWPSAEIKCGFTQHRRQCQHLEPRWQGLEPGRISRTRADGRQRLDLPIAHLGQGLVARQQEHLQHLILTPTIDGDA